MKTVFALVGFLGSAAGFQSAMPKPSQPLTVVQGGRTATGVPILAAFAVGIA